MSVADAAVDGEVQQPLTFVARSLFPQDQTWTMPLMTELERESIAKEHVQLQHLLLHDSNELEIQARSRTHLLQAIHACY